MERKTKRVVRIVVGSNWQIPSRVVSLFRQTFQRIIVINQSKKQIKPNRLLTAFSSNQPDSPFVCVIEHENRRKKSTNQSIYL